MSTTLQTSATSNYYARGGPARLVRFVLRGAQRLWPNLAQRLAKQIFLTPLPHKWQQRRSLWEAAWHIERWPFEHASLTLYSAAATASATAPSAAQRPLALLLHGWGGHAAQMKPLADSLRAQGWDVLLLEPPAHGRSAGGTSSLAQFARALSYVQARLGAQGRSIETLLAHSLGASAGAYAVARGLPVQRLVLFAAPDAPQHFTQLFAQVFGLHEATRSRMQQRVEAQEAIMMRDFDAAHIGPRIQVPTLLVHDCGDRINPHPGAQRLSASLAQATLISTEGLGHQRILKDAAVLQAVTAFLASA
jgi:pimeloyl-ACP methyl ester carboxylesterase